MDNSALHAGAVRPHTGFAESPFFIAYGRSLASAPPAAAGDSCWIYFSFVQLKGIVVVKVDFLFISGLDLTFRGAALMNKVRGLPNVYIFSKHIGDRNGPQV